MTIGPPPAPCRRIAACTRRPRCRDACRLRQDNRYVAPPPPKVTVATAGAAERSRRYLEATGNAAAVNTANLVARVQGFVQEIKYKDGDDGEEGHAALHHRAGALQAQARAGAGRRGRRQGARCKQTEADFERQADLSSRQVSTQARSTRRSANADTARGQAEAGRRSIPRQAAINLGYTAGEGAVRRHRDGAPGVARRTGRRQRPDRARHHRADSIRST